jgi:hypothetical protein
MIDVVIPCVRQRGVERLVHSLSLGDTKPDTVLIVSNEIQPFDPFGLNVKILRFDSEVYCYGDRDVALRQNVGIFHATSDSLVISGDDQIAPHDMISSCVKILEEKPWLWGNHRIGDIRHRPVEEILALGMNDGKSREDPIPPAWHGWRSSWGGMFAARTAWLRKIGAFDMAFNCRHAGEDQHLGRRIAQQENLPGSYIHEPPYSWMDTPDKSDWGEIKTNSCKRHDLQALDISGVGFLRCSKCPFQIAADPESIYESKLLIRYEASLVNVTEVQL